MRPEPKNKLSKPIFIYKNKKLYGKLENGQIFLKKGDKYEISDSLKNEMIDILPQGLDLRVMLCAFSIENHIELLSCLNNAIGDFDFSTQDNEVHFKKPIMSNLTLEQTFPLILPCEMSNNFSSNDLYPYPTFEAKPKQNLSLSGYQHKLQVSIIDSVIELNYADFILKPNSKRFWNLPLNEHLNMSFMREFGFEVPFNALIYDEYYKKYHYVIKRFDIDENGNKLPQISLWTLMQGSKSTRATIDSISALLKNKLDSTQKMQFLKYIYANALLFNNDLHTKNISFIYRNNKLILSPAYDILNVYAIIPESKWTILSKWQCCLKINRRLKDITIDDFKASSRNLGLDFGEVRANLRAIQNIYIKKYPQYVKKLTNLPYTCNADRLQDNLLDSYKKCVKVIKNRHT